MAAHEQSAVRYFWTGWFDGQSFAQLATVFVAFSLLDLLATLQVVATGEVREGNALANSIFAAHGAMGFMLYKTLLVLLILGAMRFVDRANTRLAHRVLWGGILLMAFIAIAHLAIMTSLLLVG